MNAKFQNIIDSLGKDRVKTGELLSRHTTFGIGGPADLFYEAKTVAELVKAVRQARTQKVPFFILGGGSNVLVADSGFRGLVISNRTSGLKLQNQNIIVADSGVRNPLLVKFSADHGLTGLEFLIGIPGTVGGAIRHNARFRDPRSFHEYFVDFHLVKDQFIGNLVSEVKILTPQNKITTLKNKDCHFNYSGSGLRSGFKRSEAIILKIAFNLKKADKKAIREVIKTSLQWRKTRSGVKGKRQAADPVTRSLTQEPPERSAGCIFSNVPNEWNHPTGRMIDACGLKGKRVGDAQISPLHAAYFVNLGQAKASDIHALIKLAKKEVKKKFGVDLVEEVQLVGFSAEKV